MWKADVFIGLVAPVLLLWVAVIFIRRRLYRDFPFFFSYVSTVLAVSAVRFWAINDYQIYFKVFWATEALYALLALLSLHEAFRHVFSEFYDLWWWFRLVFPIAVSMLAAFEITDAFRNPPVQAPPFVSLILSFGLTVNWIQAALFGLMCVLVWLVGNWEYYPVGIVTGFATSALGSWAAYSARSVFGTKFNFVGKYGPPLAYFVTVLIWLITFLRLPNPERWEEWSKTITPTQMLAEVREYVRILKGASKRSR